MVGSKLKVSVIGLVLFSLSFGVYFRALRLGFVNFDDAIYASDNPAVASGLCPSSIRYAFTTFDCGNWIPLTWLSLELDAALFGIDPLAFHRTNVLLHSINVVLLFVTLNRMTKSLGRSAVVALLFAVHPMHVESVAWISERKDVLSTTFLLLSLLAYEHYAAQPSMVRWLCVAATMTLGLLSKSMLVTLPAVLLLIDWWPLHRGAGVLHRSRSCDTGASGDSGEPQVMSAAGYPIRSWLELLIEKTPLFALSLIDGLITIVAQRSTLTLNLNASFGHRLGNAIIGYGWYLWTTFWPSRLRVLYPLRGDQSRGNWLIATAIILAIITGVLLRKRQERPAVLVGWGWFLISLIPVIGILQVGTQAHADRYVYIPHIGLFIMVVWQSHACLHYWRIGSRWGVGIALGAALLLSLLTVEQIGVWRDTTTLWSQVVKHDPACGMAHRFLGSALIADGRLDEAEEHLLKSFELGGINDSVIIECMGRVYEEREQFDMAAEYYKWALRSDEPKQETTKLIQREQEKTLRRALTGLKRIQHRLSPNSPHVAVASRPPNPAMKQGLLAAHRDDMPAALEHFEAAIAADPENADAYNNAALVLTKLNRSRDAEEMQRRATNLAPDNASFHVNLAMILMANAKLSEAREHFREAIRLSPNDVEAKHRLQTIAGKQ